MEKGFIKLSRSFFDNKIWQAARAFSESEAWIDLIQSARFEALPTTSRIGCYEVTYGRGQYPASNRFLAKKWGRSEQWVKSFLGKLKREKMITTENTQGINVITLVNFDKYNGEPCENQTSNPPNNPLSNPLNELSISELQRLVTHLVTHPVTHYPENSKKQPILQPTSNPNNKKDKEVYKGNIVITDVIPNSQEEENSPNGESKKAGLSFPTPQQGDSSSSGEKVDYQKLMDYYNTTFAGKLPAIRSMTDARRKAIHARIAQHGKQSVMQVFTNVQNSPFLLGANDRNWRCDFDWIFKQQNFIKILEGNYNGKRNDTKAERRESVNRLKDLAGAILRQPSPGDGE